MNPTVFAMRRPVTTMMSVVALISGGMLAYDRMRVDIFPPLNTPKIYVFLDYIGMSPDQIEGFIVNQLELYFQYVDGIRDIDTRNIQQVALCRLSFFPGTDMGQAMAQLVAMSDRARSWMPKGTLPPMIMRMDAGSVPVGYLVFESEITSLGALGDLAQNIIRPLVQKFVPGTVAISPFGPNMRSIIINVDPQKLLDYNLGPQQVVDAVATGNRIIPAGNIYVRDSMPVVSNNATVVDVLRLGHTDKTATAVLHASNATAVPRLLALLCILSVFIPAFIMADPLRSLFMPLTPGVGFAMISSYLLSSTFVPILCVTLLKHHGSHGGEESGLFGRVLKAYSKAVSFFVRLRWLTVPGYLGVCGLALRLLGLKVGTELFPQVDSGQFVLRFRPPPGSNFELTRQMAVKCLEEIEHEAKPQNIEITMGYVGQVAPNFGIDNMVLFMRGPDDGQLRVAFREDSHIKLAQFRERLRKILPERVIPWLAQRLEQGGLSPVEAERQAKMATFGFQPGDIVTNVMSFGSLTPIAVRVVGTDLKMVRKHAEKIATAMQRVPFLRDVQFEQTLDYPTIEVAIDREKAGLSGAHPARAAFDLRGGDRTHGIPLAFGLPRRPRRRALRSAGLLSWRAPCTLNSEKFPGWLLGRTTPALTLGES